MTGDRRDRCSRSSCARAGGRGPGRGRPDLPDRVRHLPRRARAGEVLRDAGLVRTRWRADPGAALAAELGGRLAGSNFAANWGSVGFFGPLTVAPEYWDQGVAQRLLDATMDLFQAWGTRHAGLFTFAQSAKHVGLYQKYGFWPCFLTAVMSSPVRPDSGPTALRLSALDGAGRAAALAAVRELTGAVYPGLDVGREIESVLAQGLGDTVLIDDAS